MSLTLPGVDRFEIVRGEVIPLSPTGGIHGQIEGNAYFILAQPIRAKRLGRLYVGEVGVVVAQDPLTVRGADVAWIHADQGSVMTSPEGYLLTPPALVVEVLSPNDRASEIEGKVQEYLRAGVQVVLLLDPQLGCATLARPDSTRTVLQAVQNLELPELLPGWSVSLAEFFEVDP
ncbi:Uma2 family endonuclease [bacterium CPR1]|nr:Uma2 family endonuclease [bacterium CPR1]